ncbi:Cyclic di-GMP phosphodiesterase Gmr [Marinomonas aquimarina]|uniref:cyclic-guanylate-specific phosphodiesterase n=1 Tax=Marinomonas aquimarina TaxID=295068 RepID=A0A1A8T4Q7_9GAMM|nr:bifunctional diguanylate cyclase/phosphodiesterase [Marinomonas aquimarina]SBS27235.1 Cyclic di-GMP phosphodiesterase Gmr [Marinomonas aquimarina]
MPCQSRALPPTIATMTEAFLSSSLGAPLFILNPLKDLEVVFTNPPSQRYFDLPEHPAPDWFINKWPEGQSAAWRDALIQRIEAEQKCYELIPKSLQKLKSAPQELCFMWFEAQGFPLIAVVMLNANSRTLSNFEPKAIQSALSLGDFYHSILDSLHDSIGLLEFDERGILKVVWLNARAMRYVAPHQDVEGQPVVAFLYDSIKQSWLDFESSLMSSDESISCSFMLGDRPGDNVCEIHFHPVALNGASQKKQFIATWHNVTKHYEQETVEAQQKQDFYNLIENAPDVIVRYDVEGRRTYVNHAFEQATGVSREAAIGKRPLELAGIGDSAAHVQRNILKAASTGVPVIERLVVDVVGAEDVIHEVRCIPEFDKFGGIIGVLLIARDFTDEERAIQQTKNSERQFRTLVENSPDFICRYDLHGKMQYTNPALSALFACPVEDMLGKTPTELNTYLYQHFGDQVPSSVTLLEEALADVIRTQASAECELSIPTARGLVHSNISLTPEFNLEGEFCSVLVIGRDLTELREYQDKANYLAKYDPLTGLPNRSNLLNKVTSQLIQSPTNPHKFGFLALGVDHFKSINDSLGYEYGDRVLTALATRLQSLVSNASYLARIGADEFGVFVSPVSDRHSFSLEAGRISEALSNPLLIGGREVQVSVSIGACLYPDDAQDLDDLVRYADSALFAAKSSQRGSIRFYSHDLTARARERMEFRNSLRAAMTNKEFCVYLQPKIRLSDGKMMGAEALVRWQHPTRGLITPDHFIPVAEELGLISAIDMQVLSILCRYLEVWQPHLVPEQRFAVNLSALQFNHEDLVQTISDTLQQNRCGTEHLELEITEGVLLVHCEHLANKILQLKQMGFTLALDDFGTGYSSLNYLSRYPIDVLKIDRSFITDMNTSRSSQVLVKTIVSMARNLNMKVVAEGVEDEQQSALLQSYDVELAQGYLFSKPIPIEQFAQCYNLPEIIND